MRDKVRVRVPATAANLGPGFDCLGMALELWNEVGVERGEGLSFSIEGEGKDIIARSTRNLVFRGVEAVFNRTGTQVPGLRLSSLNRIPLARGLGSSAAAVAGGMVAGNLLLGEPLAPEELLVLGTALEGHPDNVAPALLGGCQIVARDGDRVVSVPVPLPPGLLLALFIPDFPMPTRKARALLSPQVPREDAVFNISRAALLVRALTTGELEHLALGTQDRLHQPARRALFPAMERLFQAAREAGAYGVCLSGAGSAILALTDGQDKAEEIGRALEGAAGKEGLAGKALVTRPSLQGAHWVMPEQVLPGTGLTPGIRR